MFINEHWLLFSPIDMRLHYIIAIFYSIIAVLTLITNMLVIHYIRYVNITQ